MEFDIIKRTMNVNDIYECAQLFIKAFSPKPWNDKWESCEQAVEYITEVVENKCFVGVVLEYKCNIVGACLGYTKTWYSGNEFNILEFFIDKDCEAKGLGSEMMDYLKNVLAEKNIKGISLITGRGFPAEVFYEKHGIKTDNDFVFMSGRI